MTGHRVPSVVYWARWAGLANRLRALVGYKALAAFLDCPFYVCWENNSHCPADFEELYLPDGLQLISPDQVRALRSAGALVTDKSDWFTRIGKKYDYGGATREQFWRASIGNLRTLSLRPELARTVDEFTAEHGLSALTGLHIRYTDNLAAHRRWSGTIKGFRPEFASRLEGFEAYASREIDLAPETRLYLATDNPRVERRFRRRFGKHIVTYPKEYRGPVARWLVRFGRGSGLRTTSMSFAAIEFHLLANCRKLIGTYFSSYAQLAALINGAEIAVMAGTEVRSAAANEKFRFVYEQA